jgi:hypothetical protein
MLPNMGVNYDLLCYHSTTRRHNPEDLDFYDLLLWNKNKFHMFETKFSGIYLNLSRIKRAIWEITKWGASLFEKVT